MTIPFYRQIKNGTWRWPGRNTGTIEAAPAALQDDGTWRDNAKGDDPVFWGAANIFKSRIISSNCSQNQIKGKKTWKGFRWKRMEKRWVMTPKRVSSQLSLNFSDILTDILWLDQGATTEPGWVWTFLSSSPSSTLSASASGRTSKLYVPLCGLNCSWETAESVDESAEKFGSDSDYCVQQWILTDHHCQVGGMPSTSKWYLVWCEMLF